MSNKIYDACRNLFLSDHKLENSYMFNWESDIFLITKSKLTVEIEVKISRSDFLADFNKHSKHLLLRNHKLKNCLVKKYYKDGSDWGYVDNKYTKLNGPACWIEFANPQERIPNKFYYACPEGMIKIDEIPDYAGLIYVSDTSGAIVIKNAPQLHKLKHDWNKDLLDKYYWRNLNSKNEISNFERQLNRIESKDDQINFLCRLINKVQTILR